jgi:adenylate cyclase
MSSDEIRKLAAIMFTDMVGYSALSQGDDKLALELLEEHRELLRKIFPEFNGTEIKTIGDAFLVEFQSALEAAQCAIAIQRALAKRNADAPAERQIQVRIGVHIGDVVHRGGDVYGDGVNIASRIEPLAGAGGICVSMDVERQIRNAVETRFEKLAPTELKNISVPMELFRIVLPWEKQPAFATRPRTISDARSSNKRIWIAGAVILLLIVGIGWWWSTRPHKNPASSAPEGSQSQNIPEKSIAVLPFDNLSSDKENAYFAEGIQDEILTDLAKVADLKVISRTSVMQYRDAAARNLREIGQQLGVAHVLEGSVQRAGNEVRVNTQLINAHTDAHEWAEKYDRPINHVFAIQTEIANAIVQQLQAHLSPSEKAAIAEAPTKDLVAFDLFRRARILDDEVNDPGSGPGLFQGLSLLEEAVRRDPNFYLAYCLMAEIDLDLYWGGFDHTPGRRDHALSALKQAEGINPDAGDVHLQKADYAYHGFRDYETARSELELARKSLPNSSRLYTMIAAIDRRQARWDEAVRNFDRAVELDPRDFTTLSEAGYTYGALHRYPRASQLIQQAAALSPKDPFVRAALAESPFLERADIGPLRTELNKILAEGKEVASHVAGYFIECALAEHDHTAAVKALDLVPADGTIDSRYDMSWPRDWHVGLVAHCFNEETAAKNAFNSARTVAAKTVSEQPEYASAWTILGVIDAGLGRKSEAIAEGKRACELLPLSKDGWDGVGFVSYLALIYSWVGEKGLALDQLEISAKAPNGITYGELKLNPTWNALRGDPRFEQIVASLAPKKP